MSARDDIQTFRALIGGEWVAAAGGDTIDVFNPANDELIARVQACDGRDVGPAAEAAAGAFGEWSSRSARERGVMLHAAAANLRERTESIARLLTLEMGKPLADSRKEIADAAGTMDFFAEEGLRVSGEVAPVSSPGATCLVVRKPVGPCAAIAPWNYPVSLLAWKVSPALATGCTVVCKPSTETPAAALEFVRCIEDAGLPPGTINALTGRGGVVGIPLVEHPLIRKVSFTGSTPVGKEIMALGAKTLTRVSLELGGHSPLLVFADADFEKAVKDGVKRSFRNTGQICNAVNRIFVEESIYEEYLARFVSLTEKLTIGDGLQNPEVDIGPMVNRAGVEKTMEHVEDAVAKGARLLSGGGPPEGPQYKSDLYYKPTVLADCTLEMKIMREETFGPAVGIAPFKDLDDAIALANSTEFGLVSYAYTAGLATTRALAAGIESGTVCINNIVGSTLEAPYPGWKSSGIGLELSRHVLDEYLMLKHVRIEV